MDGANNGPIVSRRIHITGIVQGVGFRPFVYNLATRLGLSGWVLNSSSSVEIATVGPEAVPDEFIARLHRPPGGDAAIRRPCRVASAHPWAAGVPWNPLRSNSCLNLSGVCPKTVGQLLAVVLHGSLDEKMLFHYNAAINGGQTGCLRT